MPLKRTPRPAGCMKLPRSIKQNGYCGSDSKRHFRRFWVVDREVVARQVQAQKCGEQACHVTQRLPNPFGPDNHQQGHETIEQKRVNQHLDQPLPAEKCTECANELPVAAAQTAKEHQRQEDSQSHGRSDQRQSCPAPAISNCVQGDRYWYGGVREPVGNAPPTQVGDASRKSKDRANNPDRLVHSLTILNGLAAANEGNRAQASCRSHQWCFCKDGPEALKNRSSSSMTRSA